MARDLRHEMHANAALLRAMHPRVHKTFARRGESLERREAWRRGCADFHARNDALAFPDGEAGASSA